MSDDADPDPAARAAAAHAALLRLAHADGVTGQIYLVRYGHERLLARVAASDLRDRLALKGGMLMAAHFQRRATLDTDVLALGMGNDPLGVKATIDALLSIELGDPIIFDRERITAREIREADAYPGVRVDFRARLHHSDIKMRVDVSFGDPITPDLIRYPTLLPEDPEFEILAYATADVLAEKIATLIARGDANTRDRDWADVFLLISDPADEIDGADLWRRLEATAAHRGHAIEPIAPLVEGLATRRQREWERAIERLGLSGLVSRSLEEIVDAVLAFTEPLIAAGGALGEWDPGPGEWRALR